MGRVADPLDWPARIREIRARRGWTQGALAEVIHCAKGAVYNWEAGSCVPGGARRAALIALEAETEVLPVPVQIQPVARVPAPVTAFKIANGRCPVCLEYKVASVAITPDNPSEPVTPLCFLCTWLDAILRIPDRTFRLWQYQRRLSERRTESSAS